VSHGRDKETPRLLVSCFGSRDASVRCLLAQFCDVAKNGDYDPLEDLAKFGYKLLNMEVFFLKRSNILLYIFGYTYVNPCIGKDDFYFFFNFGRIMAKREECQMANLCVK